MRTSAQQYVGVLNHQPTFHRVPHNHIRDGLAVMDGVKLEISLDLYLLFSSRRRHTRYIGDWSSDVCSSDLSPSAPAPNSGPTPLLLDPSLTLPFSLPTSTDMLVTYGAGLGGTDRERERKYIPTVPTDRKSVV